MTSSGMRYSNMLPLHDTSAVAPSATVSDRPRRNQCSRRRVALRDGDEARQPRLRREQIVRRVVERCRTARRSRSRRADAAARTRAGSPSPSPSRARAARAPRVGRRAPPRAGDVRAAVAKRRRRVLLRDRARTATARRRPPPTAAAPRASSRRSSGESLARACCVGGGRASPTGTPGAARRPTARGSALPIGSRRRAGFLPRRAPPRGVRRPPARRQCAMHPCASATRWPARFPESTVDTYGGSSTRRSLEIVPVEEMSVHARHPIERIERALQPVEHLAAREKSEIARRHRREQLQADVRRRRARRDDRLGTFPGSCPGTSQCVSAVTKRSKYRQWRSA